MDRIAVKMLLGDRRRYYVIVFGLALSSFLMAHQLAVFAGVMDRTTSLIRDAHPNGIWVMDRHVLNLDDADYLPEQLSEADIAALVAEAVAATGAAGPRDMGQVMGWLSPKIKGRADGRVVSQLVGAALAKLAS